MRMRPSKGGGQILHVSGSAHLVEMLVTVRTDRNHVQPSLLQTPECHLKGLRVERQLSKFVWYVWSILCLKFEYDRLIGAIKTQIIINPVTSAWSIQTVQNTLESRAIRDRQDRQHSSRPFSIDFATECNLQSRLAFARSLGGEETEILYGKN